MESREQRKCAVCEQEATHVSHKRGCFVCEKHTLIGQALWTVQSAGKGEIEKAKGGVK